MNQEITQEIAQAIEDWEEIHWNPAKITNAPPQFKISWVPESRQDEFRQLRKAALAAAHRAEADWIAVTNFAPSYPHMGLSKQDIEKRRRQNAENKKAIDMFVNALKTL